MVLDDSPDDRAWSPPEGVRLHNGEAIPATMEFFGPPPVEIGRVSSVHSTLMPKHRPVGLVAMVLIRVGFCGAFAASAYWLLQKAGFANAERLNVISAVTWGVVGLWIGWRLTAFHHLCTYCGDRGIVELTLRGSRENPPGARMLLFAEAADLRTKQTQHRTEHGIYVGTSYRYLWSDVDQRKLLKLTGEFWSWTGKPKAHSPYWFADAGQRAWNAHYAERMTGEFERNGYVAFRVNRQDQVRLGHRFLEFVFAGRTERVPKKEFKEFRLKRGTFDILTNEARWYHNKGRYSFHDTAVSNVQMFLAALDQLHGYRF